MYLPGHRQVNFNNGWESAGQDAAQLKINLFSQTEHFGRFKGAWAEDQFKIVVRTLLHMENAYLRTYRDLMSAGVYENIEQESASLKDSPVDTLNVIFSAALLPVRFDLTADGLSAVRGTDRYSIDALSDGERAALFIAAAVIIQTTGTVLLIDEPEKHLHPSITGLLMEAAIRARPDLSMVLSTHDVTLIERLAVTDIIHIRDSKVINPRPETRVFDAHVMPGVGNLPHDLKKDLLGTRSQIVFIEGELTSSDLALYGHVYKGVKVTPRGGHEKVTNSVKMLRDLDAEHWLKPYGLIDGDGRDTNERTKLQAQNIYILPCPSIENLFFLPEVVNCFVEAISDYKGRPTATVINKRLNDACSLAAIKHRDEIVSLRLSWALERELSARKMGPKDLLNTNSDEIIISLQALKSGVSQSIDAIISKKSWKTILFRLPIKRTGLPNSAAKALGAASFDEYRTAILRQIEIESVSGLAALKALQRIMPSLPLFGVTVG